MKVTIRVETTTFETTHQGERIDAGTVQALTSRKAVSWDDVKAEALALTHTPIDETPDPLDDLNYTDVAPEVLASEAQADLANMVPANILAAE